MKLALLTGMLSFGSSAFACDMTPSMVSREEIKAIVSDSAVLKKVDKLSSQGIDAIIRENGSYWVRANGCGLKVRPMWFHDRNDGVSCPKITSVDIDATILCQ